jgi:hypothetical protein
MLQPTDTTAWRATLFWVIAFGLLFLGTAVLFCNLFGTIFETETCPALLDWVTDVVDGVSRLVRGLLRDLRGA